MSEILFIQIQRDNQIIVINKSCCYEVGRIDIVDDLYIVPRDTKQYKYKNDAIESLIKNASRVC